MKNKRIDKMKHTPNPNCPYCDGKATKFNKKRWQSKIYQVYQCKTCKKQFTKTPLDQLPLCQICNKPLTFLWNTKHRNCMIKVKDTKTLIPPLKEKFAGVEAVNEAPASFPPINQMEIELKVLTDAYNLTLEEIDKRKKELEEINKKSLKERLLTLFDKISIIFSYKGIKELKSLREELNTKDRILYEKEKYLDRREESLKSVDETTLNKLESYKIYVEQTFSGYNEYKQRADNYDNIKLQLDVMRFEKKEISKKVVEVEKENQTLIKQLAMMKGLNMAVGIVREIKGKRQDFQEVGEDKAIERAFISRYADNDIEESFLKTFYSGNILSIMDLAMNVNVEEKDINGLLDKFVGKIMMIDDIRHTIGTIEINDKTHYILKDESKFTKDEMKDAELVDA